MSRAVTLLGMVVSVGGVVSAAHAGATVELFDQDRAGWFAATEAMAPVTTVDFTGYPSGTIVTDQYEHLGISFTAVNNRVAGPDFEAHPNDGWALDGNGDVLLEFDTPQYAIATDHAAYISFELFWQGDLIARRIDLGSLGPGSFAGLVVDHPFDEARLFTFALGQPRIDDLYFAVPAPGAAMILLPFFMWPRRRR